MDDLGRAAVQLQLRRPGLDRHQNPLLKKQRLAKSERVVYQLLEPASRKHAAFM